MDRENLQKIIDQLESGNSKDDAYFGIFQYGGGPDESFIKSNREGLELFAAEILKGSRDADEIMSREGKNIIPLDCGAEWMDGDTFIQYIEPTREKRRNAKPEPYRETWKDNALRISCFVGVIIAVVSMIIGIITIVTWIF